jgi:hypothetical protein
MRFHGRLGIAPQSNSWPDDKIPSPNNRLMNGPLSAQPVVSEPGRLQRYLIFAAVVGTSLIAISGQSLWIDGALTASKAEQPTLNTWRQAMADEKTSDLQRRALSDKQRPPPRAIWID